MFSRAVSRAYRPRASDSTPMRALTASGSAALSMPSTFAVPCVGTTSVEIIRNVVVLPAPLGPRSPVMAPSGAVKVTWRTASTSPKRFASSWTAIIRSLLRAERQQEERARDPLESLAVEGLRAPLADERVDQGWGAALQAHAVPELRGDEVTRVGQRRGDLVAVARRRRRIDPAREDERGNRGAHRLVEIRRHLAARPVPAGAHKLVPERAPEERSRKRRKVRGGDARYVLGADDREVHADGKVLRHVVGELEVLRQQRIEVAGGGRGDAEGKQARELRHVERAKQPREEDAFVHLDRLAVAGARIVDGDADRALRELAAHRGDRGAQVGIDLAAPRLGLARLDQSRERRVTVGDERERQLHRGGRGTLPNHRAPALAAAPPVIERPARAVRAAPGVHLLASQGRTPP